MNTKISDAAVEAAISAYRSAFEWTDRLDRDAMLAAIAAALHYLHPQPAELSFDVEAMLTACVPGGNIVDPQLVADNIRAWVAKRKLAELAEQQGVGITADWVLGYLTTDAPEDSRDAIRNAFAEWAALAATSKQQVGEVQGDARAQFEAWAKSAGLETKIYDHNDMYSHPVTRGAWMAWQQLAARQPVGQENPLMPYVDSYRRMAKIGSGRVSCTAVADDIERNMAPHAAPPAQQVDQEYLESLDRALEGVIDQRDRYHEVADDLAGHIAAITGVEIGEHSSANCPWQNAIEAAEEYEPAQAVDLGQLPDGWSLRTLATCYQLSDGNQVVCNFVGPDAKKNAALIAALIDQRDAAPGAE